jgi:hypothetical protein
MPTTETKAKPKAKKPAAAPAPIVPVSEKLNIEVMIFDEPQNDMRGYSIASDTVKGKFVRLGHAYLWMDRPAELTLDPIRRRMGADDLLRITEILSLFAATLKKTDASR